MRIYLNIMIFILQFVIPSILYAAGKQDEKIRVILPAITGIIICCVIFYIFIKFIGWLKKISKKFENGDPKS